MPLTSPLIDQAITLIDPWDEVILAVSIGTLSVPPRRAKSGSAANSFILLASPTGFEPVLPP